ncbi:MAG: hypothetical protein ACRC5C_10710, partial [Bacilli bacterium]
GDGMTAFTKPSNRIDKGTVDFIMFQAHLDALKAEGKPVAPELEGRIRTIVDATTLNGTADKVKTYNGTLELDGTKVTRFEHIVVNGDLYIVGGEQSEFAFENVTVTGTIYFID